MNEKDYVIYINSSNITNNSKLWSYFQPNDYSSYEKFSTSICKFYLIRDYLIHKIIKYNLYCDPLFTLDLLSKKINTDIFNLQNSILDSASLLNKSIEEVITKYNPELADDLKVIKDIFQGISSLSIVEIDIFLNNLSEYLTEEFKTKNYINDILKKLSKLQESTTSFIILNFINQFDTLHYKKPLVIKFSPNDIAEYISFKQENDSNFQLDFLLENYNKGIIKFLSDKNHIYRTAYFRLNEQSFKSEIFNLGFSPVYYELAHFEHEIYNNVTEYVINESVVKKIHDLILEDFDLSPKNFTGCIWESLVNSLNSKSYCKNSYTEYKFPILLKFIKMIQYLEDERQFVTELIKLYLKKQYKDFQLNLINHITTNTFFSCFEPISSYSIIGKLFPYHTIQIATCENIYSCKYSYLCNYNLIFLLDYKNYFFEKSTQKICIPIDTFCSTSTPLKVNNKKIVIRDNLLYIDIPIFTEETTEFIIETPGEHEPSYLITVFPTTCKLIEEYKPYLSPKKPLEPKLNNPHNLYRPSNISEEISKKLSTSWESNEDELLWVLQLVEQNFYRYISKLLDF